jgi:hypothetical protein
MKIPTNLIWATLLCVALVSMAYLMSDNILQRQEKNRLSVNLEQYGRQVSQLTLNGKELLNELDKKNRWVVETDSLLRIKNKRISQLEKLLGTRIVIRDTDTVYLPLEKPIPVITTDSGVLYKAPFSSTKSCITISGFVLSTDSFPSLAITERSADIKVYDIRVRRRWWELWKPKEERYIESTCGEIEVITIDKSR